MVVAGIVVYVLVVVTVAVQVEVDRLMKVLQKLFAREASDD